MGTWKLDGVKSTSTKEHIFIVSRSQRTIKRTRVDMDVKLCFLLLIAIVSVATYPRIPRSMYLDDYDYAAPRSYRVGRNPTSRFGFTGGSRYYKDDYHYDDQPRSRRMQRLLDRYRSLASGNPEFIANVQAYNDSTTIPPPTTQGTKWEYRSLSPGEFAELEKLLRIAVSDDNFGVVDSLEPEAMQKYCLNNYKGCYKGCPDDCRKSDANWTRNGEVMEKVKSGH